MARAARGSQASALRELEAANGELRADNVELVRSVQRLRDKWTANDPVALVAHAAEVRESQSPTPTLTLTPRCDPTIHTHSGGRVS